MTLEQSLKVDIENLCTMRIDLLKREGRIAKVRREVERQIVLRHVQRLQQK